MLDDLLVVGNDKIGFRKVYGSGCMKCYGNNWYEEWEWMF